MLNEQLLSNVWRAPLPERVAIGSVQTIVDAGQGSGFTRSAQVTDALVGHRVCGALLPQDSRDASRKFGGALLACTGIGGLAESQ